MVVFYKKRQHMHSTRSRFIVNALQYNSAAFIVIAVPIFFYFFDYLRPHHLIDESITFNLDCAVALLALVPMQWITWISILASLWPVRPNQYKKKQKMRTFSRFLICLVTKGDNVQAVERTVKDMRGWQSLDKRISFHLVTEEDKVEALSAKLKDDFDVSIVGVPKVFAPLKAKYKARALEFFRIHTKLSSSDWVLHLDEETFVDAHALQTCLDLIERSKAVDFAQGYIYYNHHNYWKNWLLTLADIDRVKDDLGRYQWQANCLGKPLFGVHGSFILINGKVENAVTWDTNNLVEDYWFSEKAHKLGYKYSWIPAIAREQSPKNVTDFIAQRRRWWRGIWSLHQPVPYALIISWSWPLIAQPIRLLYYFSRGPTTRMPLWLWRVYAFDRAICLYGNAFALLVQDFDAFVDWKTMVVHQLLCPFLIPLTSVLVAVSTLSAILDEQNGFEVISK